MTPRSTTAEPAGAAVPAGASSRRRPRRTSGTPDDLPRWILVPALAAVLLVALPVVGMFVRVPWSELPEILSSEASVDALWLSLRTAAASTALAALLGVPLALVLAWSRLRGRAVLRTVVLLPLVLPPVVSGLALLTTFGRRGLIGEHLHVLGVDIAFTTVAVVLAQAFVAMPYLVIAVEGAARTAGRRHEVVAATLGASPTTVLRRVTLPLLGPALASGLALAFARCLGEFGATLTFAGSLQGVTRTLPLEIYLQRETDQDAAIALSLILIVLAAVLVLTTQGGALRRRAHARAAAVEPSPDDEAPAEAGR